MRCCSGATKVAVRGMEEGRHRLTLGRTAKSSGLTIAICEDRDAVEDAVVRFLLEERVFLAAAAKVPSPAAWSTLTCHMWVYAAVPSQVAAVRQIAAAGVDLVVVGYPCAEHDGP